MSKLDELIKTIQFKIDQVDAKVERKKEKWFNIIFPKGTSIIVVEAMLSRIQEKVEKEPEFSEIAADKFQTFDETWYIMIVE